MLYSLYSFINCSLNIFVPFMVRIIHKIHEIHAGEPELPDTIKGRIEAVLAYSIYATSGHTPAAKRAAKQRFLKHAPKGYGRRNVWRTIQHWGTHFLATGSVFDKQKSGRPPVISDEHANQLADLLVEGLHITVKRLQVWRGFRGLADARRHSTKVQDILDEYPPDLDLKSVQRRINHVAPWLPACKRTVDFKTELDPATKVERVKVSRELQKKTLEELKGVVFIDAKKVHVQPGKGYAVYDRDKERVVEDPRLPKGKFDSGIVLNYYAAVNALVGVVVFAWVTGTTGLKRVYKTLVRYTSWTDLAASIMMGCLGLYIEMLGCPGLCCMHMLIACHNKL